MSLIRRLSGKSPAKKKNGEETQGYYSLPWPEVKVIRSTGNCREPFSTEGLDQLTPFLIKLAEYSLIFLLAYFNFGYSWVILSATFYFLKAEHAKKAEHETKSQISALQPDFDRVDWINELLLQLWPRLDAQVLDHAY